MPNFELNNDNVYTIPIQTTNDAGVLEPAPAGDTFSVSANSNPAALGATITTLPSGGSALQLTPLVQASPNITVTVADSAGLKVATQIFDIIQDATPKNIVLDLAQAATTSQPVPTAPGP